ARLLSTLLVVGLLAGTSAAFAIAEGLKLQTSPITGTHLARKVFSPSCDCLSGQADFSFKVRKAGRVTVTMVDSSGREVATVFDRSVPRGRVHVTWGGSTSAHVIAPEGSYRPSIRLPDHSTVVLPNPIRIDITPPRIQVVKATPEQLVISPDADGRRDVLRVRYRVDEPAHALLGVNGERVLFTHTQRQQDQLVWNGVARGGERLPAGTYHLTLGATDTAGNVPASTRSLTVRIRFIELARHTIRVPVGMRFGVRADTDSSVVRWRLQGRTGLAHPPLLVLRAPRQPGRYRLYVLEHGHADSAVLIVRPRG
ncbi:MAG: hypothetical protein QOE36_3711, partial [Gaiellaceae bacterium]|nr:hypothetical protein [Gaiellaceae bacterium]